MRHVKKNIKPFIWMIVAAIALLFVQAFADLKLPNYMSDIVNVGIQQNGIKHASPDEISHNGLELIQSILPQKQSDEFKNYYVEKNSEVYTIKSDIDRNEADLLMGETVWTLMNMDIPGMNQGQGQTQMTMTDDFKVEALYEAIPMFQMLDQSVKETAYEKAHAMEDSLKQQTGIVMAKAFYEELGTDLNSLQNKYIMTVGAQMLGMTLLGVVAAIVIGYMSARVGSGFSKGLRRDIFMKIQSFSNEEFDKFSQSSMVVRNVNDVSQVQMMITMGIRMFIYAPIMAIGGIIMISRRDTSMTWIIALTCAILLVLLLIVSVIAVPRFKKMQKFVDRLNLVFRENLSGVMVIRAFGNKKFEDDRFDKANRDVSDLALFVNRLMSLIMPIMMFIMNVTIIAILWFGANQVSDGVLQIGDMMAFMQYSMQIIMSFLMIAMMFIFIPRAIVSLNRITEILDTEVSIQDDAKPENFIHDRKGYVEFKDVDFKYGDADEYVLKDISFTAKPGETTAFIGSTGSGKSTLINLVPRFYDVTSGEVLVNGRDVRHVEQHELRESIGYIPQKGVLLSGTARYNLTYGNENATEEEIKKALEIAQATFILNKEEGLDMEISQGGTNVSGGQKQRISIARALTKHAPIYIFDDSFSALDFKTDQLLRKSIKENMGDATLLIVAQRVNTIMDADQIVVLDNGRIMGIGKHHELLNSCPTYYEIAASQLSKEELEYEK